MAPNQVSRLGAKQRRDVGHSGKLVGNDAGELI